MKPPASGVTTRWQGYVDREGFGTTRIKNHISEKSPTMGNTHINQRYFVLCPRYFPVLGQTGEMFLPSLNSVFPILRNLRPSTYLESYHPHMLPGTFRFLLGLSNPCIITVS
jgi:hypothetical protein